ncbi:hypothetical protein D3OALGB2SA_414 [Olavius algarvensis associated proteobacterium Delta 3]|nr:hypothetical protein D3OALGB2SA_414 [Olavius algarvensis associated proteobacterium Delta 3]
MYVIPPTQIRLPFFGYPFWFITAANRAADRTPAFTRSDAIILDTEPNT